MPRVDNPNSIKESLPGQLAQVRAVTDDIKGADRQSPFSIVVGAGGAIVNGITSLLGGVLGPLNVTGSISATTSVAAGTVVTAPVVHSTGDTTVDGLLRNASAYSNPITASFRSVWVTSVDGQFGFNLSSREFKQDIEDFAVDPATVLRLRLVTFRYIAAIELLGAEAETEVGLIAEEVHDVGLTWLVEYDNGKPCGIKFHLIAMALLAVAQDHEVRLANLEATNALTIQRDNNA
jgi:hypothetical protein